MSNAAFASISNWRNLSEGIAPSSRVGKYWLLHGDLKQMKNYTTAPDEQLLH